MFATLAALSLPLLAAAAPAPAKRGGSRFTYYDTSVGLGACGNWNDNSAYTVALNSADYAAWGGGYPSTACGQQIWVSYGGNTVSATIQDECPSCSSGELDLSEGLFAALASMDLGVIYGSWGYSSGAAATTAAAETTSTWTPEPTTTSTSSAEPTSTWTPEPTTITTSSADAETTTWAAEAIVSTTESAVAAAATSAYGQETIRPWTGVNASATCPDARLVLWNVTDVTYNSTWHTVNSSLLDFVLSFNETKRFCLNSTISKYTGAANLTALVDEFKVVV